jgi:hypothetical protein
VKRKPNKKKIKSGKSTKELFDWVVADALIGWWGYYLNGTTPLKLPQHPPATPTDPSYPQIPPPMYLRPIVFVGRMYFDGFGAVRSYASVNHNGYVVEYPQAQDVGTYQINSNGVTGFIDYPSPGGESKLNFVLTNGGRELLLVSVIPTWGLPNPNATVEPYPGTCISGVAKRE